MTITALSSRERNRDAARARQGRRRVAFVHGMVVAMRKVADFMASKAERINPWTWES